MKPEKTTLLLPILLITIGTGWLLTTLEVAPGVDWIWTLGLAIVGLMTFVIGGFDKVTAVVGPFLIIASCLCSCVKRGGCSLTSRFRFL